MINLFKQAYECLLFIYFHENVLLMQTGYKDSCMLQMEEAVSVMKQMLTTLGQSVVLNLFHETVALFDDRDRMTHRNN